MKMNIFVLVVSSLFLKLIYHGAGTAVHLLLLKFSMVTTKSRLYSGKLLKKVSAGILVINSTRMSGSPGLYLWEETYDPKVVSLNPGTV